MYRICSYKRNAYVIIDCASVAPLMKIIAIASLQSLIASFYCTVHSVFRLDWSAFLRKGLNTM